MMTWTQFWRRAVMLFLLAGAGCGNTPTAVGTDSAGPDIPPAADAVDERSMPEAVVFAETVTPEETTTDYILWDHKPEDTFEPGPECEPGEGCFLDECSKNSECQSGWCVEHMGQKVCTQNCQEECPAGWTCSQVGASDPDVVFICVSNFANLCRPCTGASDCQGSTGTKDACVAYGDQGAFCGGKCGPDGACPWGFECQTVTTVDGIELAQCVADTGQCPCTDTAVELGLFTNCQVSNDFGTCEGKRICTEEGLTDCDAPEPAEETCNGLDDDCDGDVDEGDVVEGLGICDDGNECTADQCLGEDGCESVPLSEGECKDGDSCTVADHCEDGVCVGNPVLCDDGNPCTDDSCDGSGGCVFEPNEDDCDDGDPCTVGDECADGVCAGIEVPCECQVDADCLEFEDGNLCNGTLFCNLDEWPYKCMVAPATVVECEEPLPGPDAICQQSYCDPQTGQCALIPDHEGFACEDGDACTIGDKCVEGACISGVPNTCGDNNPCTDDSCDPAVGCVFVANTLPCDDGNACTLDDFCSEGACEPGESQLCDDSNPCTDDACDPSEGCVFAPNEAGCDDGIECTLGDHCAGGECAYEELASCDDGNACTDNVCDPAEGCVYTLNQAPCDDFDACTVGEVCAAGVCGGGEPLVCDDGDDCTADTCDAVQGCQYKSTCVGSFVLAVVPAGAAQQPTDAGTLTLTVGQPAAGRLESDAASIHLGIGPMSIAQ